MTTFFDPLRRLFGGDEIDPVDAMRHPSGPTQSGQSVGGAAKAKLVLAPRAVPAASDVPSRAGMPTCEFRIDPLPDFLEDHTLLAVDHAGRLAEHLRRWTQFVRSLWWLHDRVTFRLSYSVTEGSGEVQVTIAAIADQHEQTEHFDRHLALLLKAARITVTPRPVERTATTKWYQYEVSQRVDDNVWESGGGAAKGYLGQAMTLQTCEGLGSNQRVHPPVPFPWRGPGGTFQLPVATLLDVGSDARIDTLLRPVKLDANEREYLRIAAAEAESKGGSTHSLAGGHGQIRDADPAAHMAAELYLSQFRRLTNPFLIKVHCLGQKDAVARSLAAVIEATVLEPPLEGHDPNGPQLPAGATVTSLSFGPDRGVQPVFPGAAELGRLPYLADAAGAATVFRLPVSVQGGVPGIATRQTSPDYNPGPMRRPATSIDASTPRKDRVIVLGALESGGLATIGIDDLTKHTLITGFTGSGKTVTVLHVLDQLWRVHRVPFLVLESAKQEYRGFYGVDGIKDDLRVYTLGNERGVPFRLNPFELLPGERVEAHIARLQVCLEGAIPSIGPSSSVIAEALVRVYSRRGWSITEEYRPKKPADSSSDEEGPRRRFPTLSDFVDEITEVLRDRSYEGELLSNLTAALVGRLKPLLLGSKGRMFDCQRSSPTAEQLFAAPTVLEMNDLNVDDKALVVMFVLSILREHREADRRRHPELVGQLRHVTMVEEAHNVLAEVGSQASSESSADTRFKAVEAFCQMLTEIRALGEGLMIADQSPEKLARDAMRNTNLQIAHQLRDSADREAVARAMIMTEEQRDFIGKLLPGRAAVFRTGLERATFVEVPPYYDIPDPARPVPSDLAPWTFRGQGFDRTCSLGRVREAMGLPAEETRLRPLAGCDTCREPCDHRDRVHAAIESDAAKSDIDAWRHELQRGASRDELFRHVAAAASRGAARAGCSGRDGPWCYFVHMWHVERGSLLHPASQRPDDEAFRRALEAIHPPERS
jgi:hypothetical protein